MGSPLFDLMNKIMPSAPEGPKPLPNAPILGATPEERLTKLQSMPSTGDMLKVFEGYGINITDPAAVNKAITNFRGNGASDLANSLENIFNTITTGRDLPLSQFHLPSYKNQPGYR